MASITLSGDIAPITAPPSIADWGPLVGIIDVDRTIQAVLQEWLPTYCAQVKLDYGLDYEIPAPNSYALVLNEDEYLDWQMPAVLISTSKSTAVKGGQNSTWEATWRSVVSGMIRGRNAAESKTNASYLEVAIRRCMLQKCRLNAPTDPTNDQQSELEAASASIITGCEWVSSELGALGLDKRKGRYLSVGIGTYSVLTDKAARSSGGPNTPDAAPYEGLPTVSEVTVDIEPITGD